MPFYLNIRRKCFSFSSGRNVRCSRLIIYLVMIILISLIINLKRKESCWSKSLFIFVNKIKTKI
jgi:hypothetical protein